jgi:phage tail-like protein
MKSAPLVVALALAPLTANAAGMGPQQAVAGARFVLMEGGRTIASFQELKGINSAVGTTRYIYDNAGGAIQHTKQFGKTRPPTITLVRGIDSNNQLWKWHLQAMNGGPAARKQLTLQMLGAGGTRALTYNLSNCWVNKLEIGGMKAGAAAQFVETAQLECDSIQAMR